MRTLAFAFGAFILLAAVSGASAQEDVFAGLGPSRPARACLPHETNMRVPGLWLGHFTGGRLIRDESGDRVLDWRDDYSCFPTARACARWQSALLRHYHSQEGYRTCLPLRAGGWRIRAVRRASRVIVAKY